MKALLAIGLSGVAAIGFLFTRMTALERIVALIAGCCSSANSNTATGSAFRSRSPASAGSGCAGRAATARGLSLCLASAGVVKTLAVAAFTLVWTHSIEKTAWQEDWRVTAQGLELVAARSRALAPAWSRRPRRG